MTEIGVSELFVRPGRVGGAESMLTNVYNGLLAAKNPEDHLTIYTNTAHPTNGTPFHYVRVPSFKKTNRFLQEALILPWYGRKLDSMLFGNYFTPPIMPGVRISTIIHDLQQIHYPDNFSLKKRMWQRATQEFTMRKADAVITLSEFCRHDILQTYGKQFEGKLHVIPNPIAWERYEGSEKSTDYTRGADFPYLLSVTAQFPHKNLETLIRAFAVFRQRSPEYKLVLVGQLARNLVGTSRTSDLEGLIDHLNLHEEVLLTGFVSDEELGGWYRNASLFVFPSLFEGFGMPPVEALGMQVPVLTTRCGSLYEVTLGRAEYMDDPLSSAEMAERIRDMVENHSRYQVSDQTVRETRQKYDTYAVGRKYYEILRGF